MTKKILFIESVHGILRQKLEAAGFACEHHFEATREELLTMLPSFAGVVVRSRIAIDKEFIERGTNLQFIARSGSGLENIDVFYAKSKSIAVINSPEGNRDAVGEHAIGMLLMMLNNLKQADADVRAGRWPREENRGHEIAGKTIGLIGYGLMGSALAEKLAGFKSRVIAHDKYRTNFSDNFAQEVSLNEIYECADIVSLHLPLTSETRYYADAAFFSRFAKQIYFINTARGKNTDTSALVDSLKSGRVIGACLDVIEYEKASLEGLEHDRDIAALTYLKSADNVILSPHIAGWTYESYYKLSDVLAEKILAQFKA